MYESKGPSHHTPVLRVLVTVVSLVTLDVTSKRLFGLFLLHLESVPRTSLTQDLVRYGL